METLFAQIIIVFFVQKQNLPSVWDVMKMQMSGEHASVMKTRHLLSAMIKEAPPVYLQSNRGLSTQRQK